MYAPKKINEVFFDCKPFHYNGEDVFLCFGMSIAGSGNGDNVIEKFEYARFYNNIKNIEDGLIVACLEILNNSLSKQVFSFGEDIYIHSHSNVINASFLKKYEFLKNITTENQLVKARYLESYFKDFESRRNNKLIFVNGYFDDVKNSLFYEMFENFKNKKINDFFEVIKEENNIKEKKKILSAQRKEKFHWNKVVLDDREMKIKKNDFWSHGDPFKNGELARAINAYNKTYNEIENMEKKLGVGITVERQPYFN